MNKNVMTSSEEWEQLKTIAELMLKVADNEGWSKADLTRLLAELALKAYNTGVQEWHHHPQK